MNMQTTTLCGGSKHIGCALMLWTLNLWRAIKVAKNLNQDTIPLNLTHGGLPIEVNNRANAFATFFKEKITTHVVRARVSPNVYNGSNKIMVLNRNFMLPKDIKECMLTLQSKKCEGFDQIPLCVITDARDILLDPMADLFSKIYLTGAIPDQFKLKLKNVSVQLL